MRRPSATRLVWLTWWDAQTARVTHTAVESADLAVNCNLGWLISENKRRIVLAHGFSTSGEIDVLVVPTDQVKSIKAV